MHVVEVENLTHYYGERKALSNVSFQVEEAEIFSFLGPNGGGKTTLFRILSTLLLPTEGTARIFDLDTAEHSARVRQQIESYFKTQALISN